MPGRDGTGPLGRGAMSGRGLGYCSGYPVRYGPGRRFGLGLGCGRGLRRYPAEAVEPRLHKELLEEERELLQDRLSYIKKQLDGLSEEDK